LWQTIYKATLSNHEEGYAGFGQMNYESAFVILFSYYHRLYKTYLTFVLSINSINNIWFRFKHEETQWHQTPSNSEYVRYCFFI